MNRERKFRAWSDNRIMTYDPKYKEKSRIQMELFNQYQDAPFQDYYQLDLSSRLLFQKSYSKKKKEYLLINPYKITAPICQIISSFMKM